MKFKVGDKAFFSGSGNTVQITKIDKKTVHYIYLEVKDHADLWGSSDTRTGALTITLFEAACDKCPIDTAKIWREVLDDT